MIIQESMTLKRKLEILSDAAKYDVACTSSGVDRKGDGKGMGNSIAAGICHSFAQDELRPLPGMDESVFNYVMDNETARIFANKLEDMVEFLIPKYAQEGKTSLVIAVGCTGGKHRSVTIARELYSRIARNGEYGFRLEHRDVDKDRLLKK